MADATYAAGFAHLAAGDLVALRQDVAACSAASKAARDPLRGVRAQLLLCEQLRRSGSRDEALRTFAPLRRMPASALPRLLRCQREMMADLLAGDVRCAEVLSQHIVATGFHALALFVPKAARVERLHGSPSTPVDDAIEVLRLCQNAADESATLMLVCEQVQRQTHAAALGFFGIEPGGLALGVPRSRALTPSRRSARSTRAWRLRRIRPTTGSMPRCRFGTEAPSSARSRCAGWLAVRQMPLVLPLLPRWPPPRPRLSSLPRLQHGAGRMPQRRASFWASARRWSKCGRQSSARPPRRLRC